MNDMAPVGAALLAGVGIGVFKDVYEASAKVEKSVYMEIQHSDALKRCMTAAIRSTPASIPA